MDEKDYELLHALDETRKKFQVCHAGFTSDGGNMRGKSGLEQA